MADFDVALIPVEVEAARIRDIMGPTLAELRAAVAAQGLDANGPWLTHHWRRPGEKFEFDLCLPTPHPISATGRVRPGLISAPRIARCEHVGDYSRTSRGMGGVFALDRNPRRQDPRRFLGNLPLRPGIRAAAAEWRTELVKPLV